MIRLMHFLRVSYVAVTANLSSSIPKKPGEWLKPLSDLSDNPL
jgi:hypothetical protein